MPDVIVVGAGPVGTFLAAELSRHGLETTLLERRETSGESSRAIGLHAPVLAALEPGGATERILAGAVRVTSGECRRDGTLLGTVRFDRLAAQFPFVATLPQPATEAALSVGAPAAVRGVTVTSVRPDGDRVRVRSVGVGGEREWEAATVVVASGAGGRDLVYRSGGVAVRRYPDRYVMADASVGARADAEVAVVSLAPEGVLESFPLPNDRRRFVAWDGRGDELVPGTRDDRLRRALIERGEPDAAASIAGATTFRVQRAVAPRLRRGRVLVVGDAAHEVSPIGGQGMNLGLLDAAGLAPLLAEWVGTGVAPDAALEKWERRRVRSARIAAGLAALNTALGRPHRLGPDSLRTVALRAALAGRSGRLLARAYAMDFDRGA